MRKPTDSDLRKAAHIDVVRQDVEEYLAKGSYQGRPLHGFAIKRFYYLGKDGREEGRITAEYFSGAEEEKPIPGYYAVEVCTEDGKLLSATPWFAVVRDPRDSPMERERDRSPEAGYGHLYEEYRVMHDRMKRELSEQVRRNERLQKDVDTFGAAYAAMHRRAVGAEFERNKAIVEAAEMEGKMRIALERCEILEAEASSFAPQMRQFVDHAADRVLPEIRKVVMDFAGFDIGADLGGDEKAKTPPWAAGRSASEGPPAEEKGEAPKTKVPPGARQVPENEPVPEGIATPEYLANSLCWLFYEFEPFGKWACLQQKNEDGTGPMVPWWLIRSLVFYAKGLDVGPDPLWPSDAEKAEQDRKKGSSMASAPAASEASAASAEVVPEGDRAGEDAIDVSGDEDDEVEGEGEEDAPAPS